MQEQYENAQQKAEQKKKDLTKITDQIEKKIGSGDFQPADAIIHNIIEQVSQPSIPSSFPVSPAPKPVLLAPQDKPVSAPPQSVPKPSKMVSFDKVKEIIRRIADEGLASLLIERIEEET